MTTDDTKGEKPDLDQPRHDLENTLTLIKGVAEVLLEMGKHRDGEAASYLGGQLLTHSESADDAFNRMFGLSQYHDPVLAQIAEEERVRLAGIKLQDQAFVAKEQSAEGDALVKQAGALLDKIKETTPTTLAGVAAMIELADYQSDQLLVQALAGLRAIMAGAA